MRRLLLFLVIASGCATNQPPVPEPHEPKHFMIPIEAKNTDFICAETLPELPNFCMTVREFRIRVVDQRVEP